jgi:L-threonylcarbamoyladenylate synthase
METVLLKARAVGGRPAELEHAVKLLRAGEVVALPTETVYGLAGDALNVSAVAKIFEAKERPFFDPLIVHLPARAWLAKLASIPADDAPLVEALTGSFWPGALTLILPRHKNVPDVVTAGLETVAVRMSSHPIFRAVIEAVGGPLAAPSANRFGRISPTSTHDVVAELGGRIPAIVDDGPTPIGIESTIARVHAGKIDILRHGPVSAEELAQFASVESNADRNSMSAPGQFPSHYAPRTPLRIIPNAGLGSAAGKQSRAGLLAWRDGPPAHSGYAAVEVLSARGDLREAAATLFAKMRRLDGAALDRIDVEPVPAEGLGLAIMERLRKASHE